MSEKRIEKNVSEDGIFVYRMENVLLCVNLSIVRKKICWQNNSHVSENRSAGKSE